MILINGASQSGKDRGTGGSPGFHSRKLGGVKVAQCTSHHLPVG